MGQVMNRRLKEGEKKVTNHDWNDILNEEYDTKLKGIVNFDDFYHAVYVLVEDLNKKSGAIQITLHSKDYIKKAYEKNHMSSGNVTREDCAKIIEKLIKVEDIQIGKKAWSILAIIYGAPICAFLATRFIPGAKPLSDDVAVPLATSGAVLYLAKTNKL